MTIHPLLLINTRQGGAYAKILEPKTNPKHHAARGCVFGIAVIDIHPSYNERIIKLIETELEKYYASQDDIENLNIQTADAGISEGFSLGYETVFEGAIQNINTALSEFAEREQLRPDKGWQNFHCLLGVLHGKDVVFTVCGDFAARLFYQTAKHNLQVSDILEGALLKTDGGAEKKDFGLSESPAKDNQEVFSHIFNGQSRENDLLVFCTKNLLKYLALSDLAHLFASLSPKEAVGVIKDLLLKRGLGGSETKSLTMEEYEQEGILNENEETNTLTDSQKTEIIAALFISPVSAAAQKRADLSEGRSSQESLEKLLKRKDQTKKILSPTLASLIQDKLHELSLNLRFFKKTQSQEPLLRFSVSKISQTIGKIFLKTIEFVLKILTVLLLLLKEMFLIGTNWRGRRQRAAAQLKRQLEAGFGKLIFEFNHLPRFSKILLVSLLVVGSVFAGSLFIGTYRNQKIAEAEVYALKINELIDKKNSAEASLVYGDEKRARELFAETEQILAELPQNSKKRKETHQALQKDLETVSGKLRRLETIANPTLVASLLNDSTETIGQPLELSPRGLLNLNADLYSWDTQTGRLYKINPNDRTVLLFPIPRAYAARLNLGSLNKDEKENQSLVFYADGSAQGDGGLLQFHPQENRWENLEYSPPQGSFLQDIKIYNEKLYILDIANGQIWKHPRSANGFEEKEEWIKNNVDIKDSVSFTIDGSIYVLKSNGEILNFFRGKKQEFKTAPLDPELISPAKIFTTTDMKYLYVLEPLGKRLIVFGKDGMLIKQYYSEYFDNLIDFVIFENEKKIYLLNGTKIYGIPAKHL